MEIGLKIWKIMKWVSLVFQFIMFCSGIAIIVHRRKAGKVDRLNPQSEHDDESESDEEDTENGFHTMKGEKEDSSRSPYIISETKMKDI